MKILTQGLAQGNHKNAVTAFNKGGYKEAADIWMDIIDNNEKDLVALKGVAVCLFLDNKIREARGYLQDALVYASTDPEIVNLLALTYLKEGNVQQAIEDILDAQEFQNHTLLNNTLNKIKTLSDPDHAQMLPLVSLIQITLPRVSLIPVSWIEKITPHSPVIIIVFLIGIIALFYPSLRNLVTSLNLRNRASISTATQVTIQGIESLIDAREKFQILLDEPVIARKFEQLRQAISDRQHNRARIIVNELLASNASLAVKERVGILESFIVDSNVDDIDYVPKYAEIAVAPMVYQGVMLRWQGTVANIHHQGRKKTTFDLFVNLTSQSQVEGIAVVEIEGFHEYNNGDKITVIGPVLGMTKDNRVILKGERILK